MNEIFKKKIENKANFWNVFEVFSSYETKILE